MMAHSQGVVQLRDVEAVERRVCRGKCVDHEERGCRGEGCWVGGRRYVGVGWDGRREAKRMDGRVAGDGWRVSS